jgi:hypothetical protein
VTAGLSLPAGIFCIGSLLAPEVLGINLTPLTFFLGLLLGSFLVFSSVLVFIAGILIRIVPPLLKELRASIEAQSQEATIERQKQRAASSPNPLFKTVPDPGTLFKVVKEAPDQIVFASAVSPLAWTIILIVGMMFAGAGALFLGLNLNQMSARHRAESIPLPQGARLPYLDLGVADWAVPTLILGLGLLLIAGALWLAWTSQSLIINPEKRELVRKITLRWPAWSFTKVWQASDLECVHLDEHVTVWPGTPKFWTLWKVEPRETSDGHVWIRFRTGKELDCGKGAWEVASELASRLGGLLGAPKIIRERFEVGPPPSTDTSS